MQNFSHQTAHTQECYELAKDPFVLVGFSFFLEKFQRTITKTSITLATSPEQPAQLSTALPSSSCGPTTGWEVAV